MKKLLAIVTVATIIFILSVISITHASSMLFATITPSNSNQNEPSAKQQQMHDGKISSDKSGLQMSNARLDLGTVAEGKSVSQNIIFTNTANEMRQWFVDFHPPADIEKKLRSEFRSRYFAFGNKNSNNGTAKTMGESMLSDGWFQTDTGLTASVNKASLDIVFNGTGVSIIYQLSFHGGLG